MLAAVGPAAGTWGDRAGRESANILRKYQDHPPRLSGIVLTRRWSHQCRCRTSSERRHFAWI